MKVYGYVRVSTHEQESGYGPEVQEQAIRAYCTARALAEPVIVFESASAESLAGRRELLQLLARAKSEVAEGPVHLVFFSSDRLARALLDQESAVAASFTHGYRFHSTRSHEADFFDPAHAKDPMRTAIRQFFGLFNQLDKAIIQQRLDGGLLMKASKGGSTGGRYPFGYQSVNGEISPCPAEVPVVRRVFALAARRCSLQDIASRVAIEYPDLCGHWSKTSIKRVLDRRDLYVRGLYRSRMAEQEASRPDLILCGPTGDPP